MLAALLLLGQGPSNEVIAKIDALAKARDVDGLSAYLAPFKGRHPLGPLRTGGCYGTGRFGWRAIYLRMLNEGFMIFTTPLTSEDIGELVFRFDRNGKLEYIPEQESNGLRIASHDFDVRFDLEKKKALIKDTIELQMVGRRTMTPMLRLGPNYRVSKITDSQNEEIAFLQAGGILCLPGVISAQRLTLHYSAVVDQPRYAGSISTKEAMLTNDYWWPMIARQPAPYRLTVTVPKDWKPVAQGDVVQDQITATGRRTTFEMKVPVSYYSFSAGPYTSSVSKTKGREFRMWSNMLSKPQLDLQNEIYPPLISFFERFARYPFTGWGAVVSDAYGGGALEAYSFATYGGGMPGEDAHETSHTWWGGLISNTYLHSLWNESFASFCEGYYARNVEIGNPAERRLAFVETPQISDSYKEAAVRDASPFIGPAATSIGYGKGAFVLQMLEEEIGSDRLLRSMQEWQRVHPKDRGGEWQDFEAAVHRIMGNDTHWFFEQWVNRPGWVDFEVEDLRWTKDRLVGFITFKSEPYLINTDVMLVDASGKRSFGRAALSTNLREARQQFVIPCPEKPALVSFDPWRRILRPIKADEDPVELRTALRSARRYTDPSHPKWLSGVGSSRTVTELPSDLDGMLIVGHPDTTPRMQALCERAGLAVKGSKLTYDGTEIDLAKSAALAVVELAEGKRCVIGLGQTRMRPHYGRARLALVDDLGRFLRGKTEPKTNGFLTFRNP